MNAGEDLTSTVSSVLAQEFNDYELIVKDGGSGDGSFEALKPDPHVRIVRRPDRGIFDAMNQALCAAHGYYVHFLNAGDTFTDKGVLKHVAHEIHRYPDKELFYGDVRKPQSRSGYEIYPRRLSRRFLFMNSVCHQGWFVRRVTYLRYGGFDTSPPVGADPRLLLRMVVGGGAKHRHIPRVVAVYKGGGASTAPEWKKKSLIMYDSLRRELYHPAEYVAYRLLQACRGAFKSITYDAFGWRLGRLVQACRINGRKGPPLS